MKLKKLCVIGVVCVSFVTCITFYNDCSTGLNCLVPISKTHLKESDSFDSLFSENQEFRFLGYGMQSVAFESLDSRYVIKFFTKKPFELNLEKKTKRTSFREKWNLWKRNLKFSMDVKFVLRNYSFLFSHNPEIAALVAVHLDATKKKLPRVTLLWPDNFSTQCDLNDFPFVVQKKARLVYEVLQQEPSKQNKLMLLEKLRQFLITRASLGFMDKRKTMSLHKNFGFVDGFPVQFDAGNVVYEPCLLQDPNQEIDQVLELFDLWIRNNQKHMGFE